MKRVRSIRRLRGLFDNRVKQIKGHCGNGVMSLIYTAIQGKTAIVMKRTLRIKKVPFFPCPILMT